MSRKYDDTCEKRPFFTLQPFIILDEVRIREDGIEAEERERIQVPVQRNRPVQACSDDFRRLYLD